MQDGTYTLDGGKHFLSVLKRLRQERGWSSRYIGHRIGEEYSNYLKYENRVKTREPTWKFVQKLCLLFEVSPEVFINPAIQLNPPPQPGVYPRKKSYELTPEFVEKAVQALAKREWLDTNAEIGAYLGISGQAVTRLKREKVIVERVKELRRERKLQSTKNFAERMAERVHTAIGCD